MESQVVDEKSNIKRALNVNVSKAPLTQSEVSARLEAAKIRGKEVAPSSAGHEPSDPELSAILEKLKNLDKPQSSSRSVFSATVQSERSSREELEGISEGRRQDSNFLRESSEKDEISINADMQSRRLESILKENLAISFSGYSDDNKVVAMVNGNGRLINLHIDDDMGRSSSRAVESAVMAAISTAKAAATEQWLARIYQGVVVDKEYGQ
ncbi:YbaB/EbfC family nucleoid-associated protein [Actinomadura xylanilytica]|uniref:YbaB/EbfC family nucleoid-associated protein n=1 Tax=Actinomadura xylanilytica TaxID=887459 RepID=UPI00255A883C|nr:YbaB/EbfC family nucleoid-associated protein [Actinomadura xylanilytica]MDL4772604.1 YbaB/EbfC family nucleoid-associated protein [Actinomadura xylanilytica]